MATIDEILGGSQGGGSQPATSPAKGTQERSEQEVRKPTSVAKKVGKTEFTMEEIYDRLYPERPMTAEELEKERKKHKRNKLFAAIGDGVSALANLFFTTQYAPNMYSGKNTMSERAQIRYDRLMKENDSKRNVFFNGLVKARQADDEAARSERSWQRQLGLDQEARDRRKEDNEHRDKREKIADERYNAEQQYKKERDAEGDRRWQATFDENKRRADRNYNFNVRKHNDNVTIRKESNASKRAGGVRGKQLGFADGQGNQVAIYENVWKGSMQQVYDAMLTDLAPTDEKERRAFERKMKRYDTPQKKADYVKQNWHKSPKASGLMLALSKLDPATMTSEISDDEDYSQYEDYGDEDYSQYEV